jgi:hypothetical protein
MLARNGPGMLFKGVPSRTQSIYKDPRIVTIPTTNMADGIEYPRMPSD